jgi:hypothetical protein
MDIRTVRHIQILTLIANGTMVLNIKLSGIEPGTALHVSRHAI